MPSLSSALDNKEKKTPDRVAARGLGCGIGWAAAAQMKSCYGRRVALKVSEGEVAEVEVVSCAKGASLAGCTRLPVLE